MENRMVAPVVWVGGKARMIKHLLPLVPVHRIYIELFGGGAALLFAKQPSPLEVYNDVNIDLVNFFRVLRTPKKFQEFHRKICLVLYSRQEFEYSRDNMRVEDDVEWAVRFFTVVRQCFGSFMARPTWGYAAQPNKAGRSPETGRWLSVIDKLPELHARMRNVQVEGDDWRKVLKRFDSPSAFIYADPPYYIPGAEEVYADVMSKQDHIELLAALNTCAGKVMISGYSSNLYEDVLSNWWRAEFSHKCLLMGRTRTHTHIDEAARARTEVVWTNYTGQVKRPLF